MKAAAHYFFDPLDDLPNRWRDHHGPLRVIAGPVKGWVMVQRLNAVPFVLHVRNLTNAERHPVHGPFTVVGRKVRLVATGDARNG
jgi:hypothetical protein